MSARQPVPGPLPDRASGVTAPSPPATLARDPAAAVLSPPPRGPHTASGWGEGWPPASASPQRALLLPVCRRPCRSSSRDARTRVPQFLARARCPIVCPRLSRRPFAAPPALQELLHEAGCSARLPSPPRTVCPGRPPPSCPQPRWVGLGSVARGARGVPGGAYARGAARGRAG